MSNEKSIEKEPYYHGLLPREDVNMILAKNGDFLVRISEPSKGESRQFILSAMHNVSLHESQAIKHFVIKNSGKKWMIDKYQFDSIQQMIKHHLTRKEAIKDVFIIDPICRQHWELEHDQILITKKLGEGAFGEVSMGTLKLSKRSVNVAIKQEKLETATKDQIKEFMAEARIMRSLCPGHPNVVKFYGVAVSSEPLYLVMELASNGALINYIRNNEKLPLEKRTEMVLQAAWGLEYLHSIPVVHRDIAARNCLYGDDKVKISDFGMSRKGETYLMKQRIKVPIRWLAVETLKTHWFSQMTDVWSFAVLCWEIYSNGIEPYDGMSALEVDKRVRAGLRLKIPDGVHDEIGKMMMRCWMENPSDRFTISEITSVLQRVAGISRPDFHKIEKDGIVEMMTRPTSKRNKKGDMKKRDLPRAS